jgi:hypothetical protein
MELNSDQQQKYQTQFDEEGDAIVLLTGAPGKKYYQINF